MNCIVCTLGGAGSGGGVHGPGGGGGRGGVRQVPARRDRQPGTTVKVIEEEKIQKKRQRSPLLFGGRVY